MIYYDAILGDLEVSKICLQNIHEFFWLVQRIFLVFRRFYEFLIDSQLVGFEGVFVEQFNQNLYPVKLHQAHFDLGAILFIGVLFLTSLRRLAIS